MTVDIILAQQIGTISNACNGNEPYVQVPPEFKTPYILYQALLAL